MLLLLSLRLVLVVIIHPSVGPAACTDFFQFLFLFPRNFSRFVLGSVEQ